MWDEWDELQDARELAEGALELWMEEEVGFRGIEKQIAGGI